MQTPELTTPEEYNTMVANAVLALELTVSMQLTADVSAEDPAWEQIHELLNPLAVYYGKPTQEEMDAMDKLNEEVSQHLAVVLEREEGDAEELELAWERFNEAESYALAIKSRTVTGHNTAVEVANAYMSY